MINRVGRRFYWWQRVRSARARHVGGGKRREEGKEGSKEGRKDVEGGWRSGLGRCWGKGEGEVKCGGVRGEYLF